MRKLFGLTIISAALFLVGCEADPAFNGSSGGAGAGGGGAGGGGGGTTTVAPALGSGTGAAFQNGVIAVSQTMLQAGGSTSLTVDIVDTNNNNSRIVGDDVTVNFSSGCTPLLANIVEAQVTNNLGTATSTYSATGCSGDDIITATAVVNGTALNATVTINVAPATVGSIQFVSADPTNIGLLGTGGVGRQETSTVRFAVTDSTGGPVSGADVDFTLNTTIGGITMTPTSATSGTSGEVQTVVSAGSVATSVRVTATVAGSSPVIAAQSDQLTITTGIPDDDSVSLSVECVNIEGWNLDGIATDVTVRLSDRYNNPVPDGTAITLNAEGGQIGGSCQTTTTPADGAGVCTVTFVSQNPRPANGRASIIAFAIGEETFIDADADGIFNNADTPIEIGEPFRDDDEDGIADTPPEFFADFNSNGIWDDATQPDYVNFNGLLCDSMTALCSPNETLFVSDSNVIVMSSSAAVILDNVGGTLDLTGGPASVTFTIGDINDQPMAGGTTIDAETSNGNIVGPDNYVVPCSNADMPLPYSFTLEPDSTPDSGVLSIEVTSPSGLVTTYAITVDD